MKFRGASSQSIKVMCSQLAVRFELGWALSCRVHSGVDKSGFAGGMGNSGWLLLCPRFDSLEM